MEVFTWVGPSVPALITPDWVEVATADAVWVVGALCSTTCVWPDPPDWLPPPAEIPRPAKRPAAGLRPA